MHSNFIKQNGLRQIPDFPGYFITKDGHVWSAPKRSHTKGKWMKSCNRDKLGHQFVVLCKNSKCFNKAIHRLVLETFVGPCPEGMECRHLNGNPKDNRLKNLRWGTGKDNGLDKIIHGTTLKGESNGRAKLTEQDVRMIIYMYQTGLFSQREIAAIYNVSQRNILFIVHKKHWKHIWNN